MADYNNPESRNKGKSKKAKDPRKSKEKFPTITKKVIDNSDIVLEILSSQFIKETRNLQVEKKIKEQGKQLIYVFNKSDLSKPIHLRKFSYLQPQVWVSCKEREGIRDLRNLILKKSKQVKRDDGERIAIGVIGYPNTGKSSLINILSGKTSAKTSSEAGYTKGLQKIRLNSNIVLIDTPGIIQASKYSGNEPEKIASHAKIGSRSYSQIREPEMVIAKIMKEHPGILEKHYRINAEGDSEKLIEEHGKEKGFMQKGGVDEKRSARKIIKDWQEGLIEL